MPLSRLAEYPESQLFEPNEGFALGRMPSRGLTLARTVSQSGLFFTFQLALGRQPHQKPGRIAARG